MSRRGRARRRRPAHRPPPSGRRRSGRAAPEPPLPTPGDPPRSSGADRPSGRQERTRRSRRRLRSTAPVRVVTSAAAGGPSARAWASSAARATVPARRRPAPEGCPPIRGGTVRVRRVAHRGHAGRRAPPRGWPSLFKARHGRRGRWRHRGPRLRDLRRHGAGVAGRGAPDGACWAAALLGLHVGPPHVDGLGEPLHAHPQLTRRVFTGGVNARSAGCHTVGRLPLRRRQPTLAGNFETVDSSSVGVPKGRT